MDSSNNIIYPSLYNIYYPPLTNKYTYYLESLTPTDLHLWYNCFDYSNNNISINYFYYTQIIVQLYKAIFGNFTLIGKPFSNHNLKMGNLYLYYLQFLSNGIFKHPYAFQPFENNKSIKKTINNSLEHLMKKCHHSEFIINLLKTNFINNQKIVINNGDTLQFEITLISPKLNYNIKIPTSTWIITIPILAINNI
tara:strand:- start:197 stop:781 length:585 start_codon:yes stop_codon:yes gene_type:complete